MSDPTRAGSLPAPTAAHPSGDGPRDEAVSDERVRGVTLGIEALGDEALMERYQNGDQSAFQPLFERHAARVYGFLYRHTGDRALAEDLLQQTWFKVHRACASYRSGAPFAPWLYTIANNARRDAARADFRAREELTTDGNTPDRTAPWESDDPDTERVRAALGELAEPLREVIILHRWLDLSFAEIATVLCATEGAVKVRAHRGYLALRELLRHTTPSAEAEPVAKHRTRR